MGEVYAARDTRLERTVAIKVLSPDVAADPDLRRRFEREARTIAALDHPHICAIYDVGDHEGTHFIVMPRLDGETLEARLARSRGPLPIDEALRIAIEIADALDRAHRAGITHRDLKPANIMLTKSGVKLLDFGLAKLKGSVGPLSMTTIGAATTAHGAGTASGTIPGTIHYMSPEQVEGREADARSDIWTLGVVTYEMATGTRPFDGDSGARIIGAILKDTPPLLSSRQPLSPPVLDHLVSRCLEKDPEDRWQAARDVARSHSVASVVGPWATSASHFPSGESARSGVGSVACGLTKLVCGGAMTSNRMAASGWRGDRQLPVAIVPVAGPTR
jgi:serine/threonine-protein kinase